MSTQNNSEVQDDKPTEVTPVSTVERTDPGDIWHPESDADIRKPLSEGVEKKVVDFNAFNEITGKGDEKPADKTNKAATVPPETADKTVDKAEFVKPAEDDKEVVKVPDVKVETDTAPQVEDDKTKYGEAAAALLPQMSKKARDFFKARLDNLGEIAAERDNLKQKLKSQVGTLPASYLEHPRAFVLDPQYEKSARNIQDLEGEMKIWKQQLIAIRNGNNWKEPIPDGKGGITYIDREAGAEADIEVSEKLAQAKEYIGYHRGVINNLEANFKQGYEAQKATMTQLENKYFPEYTKDRKAMVEDKHFKAMSGALDSVGQGDNILKAAFSNLYRFSMEREAYIQKLEGEAKSKVAAANKVISAGPNSGDLNQAGAAKKAGVEHRAVDFDAFARAKE